MDAVAEAIMKTKKKKVAVVDMTTNTIMMVAVAKATTMVFRH
jgi:hypothetical protein